VKPGPTATNDQDDNERPTRYLECQPRSKDEQVNGLVNMVMRRIKKECSVCHVQHNIPTGLMKHTLNKVYRAILTRNDRDPRKSDNAEKPWFYWQAMDSGARAIPSTVRPQPNYLGVTISFFEYSLDFN
jgi:hypothetical protein